MNLTELLCSVAVVGILLAVAGPRISTAARHGVERAAGAFEFRDAQIEAALDLSAGKGHRHDTGADQAFAGYLAP